MINYIIINTIILRDTRMESGNRNLKIGIWNGSFRLPYFIATMENINEIGN